MAVTLFGIDLFLFTLDLIAFFALYLAIGLTLNLEFGFAGIPNFGKVLFIVGGASVAGSFAGRFCAWIFNIDVKGDFIRYAVQVIPEATNILKGNVPMSLAILVLSVAVAGTVGAIFGFVFSYPAIRLREDYLAMTLLGMAQFFQIFLTNYAPLIGGSLGLQLPDPYAWAGDNRFIVATGMLVVFAAAVYAYMQRIANSPLGRTLRAVRDNEVASEALGKDDVSIRRKTLVVASAISGIAGVLYAFYTVNVLPATYNRVVWTFWPWVMVIMGGAANNPGVAIGVFAFWFLVKTIDSTKFVFSHIIPFDVVWLEYLLIGGIFIVILMVRPQGILPEKPTVTIPTERIRKIITGALSAPSKLKAESD